MIIEQKTSISTLRSNEKQETEAFYVHTSKVKGKNFFSFINKAHLVAKINLEDYLEIVLVERDNVNGESWTLTFDPKIISKKPMILFAYAYNQKKTHSQIVSIWIHKHILVNTKWETENYIKETFNQGLIDIFQSQSFEKNIIFIETILQNCFTQNLKSYQSPLNYMVVVDPKKQPFRQAETNLIYQVFDSGFVYGFQILSLNPLDQKIDNKKQIELSSMMIKRNETMDQNKKISDMNWQRMIDQSCVYQHLMNIKEHQNSNVLLSKKKQVIEQAQYRELRYDEKPSINIIFRVV